MDIVCTECGHVITEGNYNCPLCEEYFDFITSLRKNIRRADEQKTQTQGNGETPPQM
jgi:hypothetical protein